LNRHTTQHTITFPHPPGSGGPGSFQTRFENELKTKNWKITYAGKTDKTNVIFIVGGTRKIFWLIWMKLKGIPIILRLDGIVWLHKKKKVSFKHYIKASSSNLINKFIHAFLANTIVYQSEFVKQWWKNEAWVNRQNTYIIYNAVTITNETQDIQLKHQQKRLVVLEGVIDYSPYAVKLLNQLASALPTDICIEIYGNFEDKGQINLLDNRLFYKGFVGQNEVRQIMTGAVYLSLDINPACPNAVIEALSCGSPVVGFKTGALPELVPENCGSLVSYGSNPWQLSYPDVNGLVLAINKTFKSYNNFSDNAFKFAVNNFDIHTMTKQYCSVIDKLIS
jgi:glycosyltransferase involved in cell wall biosynthesis